MKFTEQQIEAIEHYKGSALVLAVPGSGKTTVLLNRILNLIEKYEVNPNSILSITFSKAQGIDMENRFNKNNPDLREKVTFKTIHAFCYEIVRSYFKSKNIKKTLIEGTNEFNRNMLLKRAYFEKFNSKLNDDIINDFFSIYDYTQNKVLDFDHHIRTNKNISHRKTMLDLFTVYTKLKTDNGYMDFNDLLILANQYISENPELLKAIKRRYKFFQIDEGQDTSTLQFEIVRKIVYPENNVFVVADDDQSIYSFRGASPENLLNFEKFYPNSKIFFMDKNFRSTKNIITISNGVIKTNKNRYAKEVKPTIYEDIQAITLVNAKTSKIQYRELLKRLNEVPKNESIGILYRNNISSICIGNLFFENNVDFFIKDTKFDFFSNKILNDIKDILIFSEDTSNLESFRRIYFKLNAYIKKEYIAKLQYKNYNENVFDALLDIEGLNHFYFSKFSELRNDFKKIKRMRVRDKISYIFDFLGYGEYLENLHEDNNLNYNLIFDLILNISENLEHTEDFFKRLDEIKDCLNKAKNSKSNISISTIHSSKGLEYDNVFIVDLVKNEFPMKNNISELTKIVSEEERRIFYVAITRAKKRLFLFTVRRRNGKEVSPSIFYNELKQIR